MGITDGILASSNEALASSPLVQGLFSFAFDSELAIVNIAFIFACLAGILTSYKNKQLNIGVFSERLPEKSRKVVTALVQIFSIAVLLGLFFATFPNILTIINPDEKVWLVPVRIIFLLLPLMYISMVILEFRKKTHIAVKLTGILLGLFISAGSISTILYQIFQVDSQFLYAIFDFHTNISGFMLVPLILFFVASAFFGMPLYIVLAGISYAAFMQGGGYVDVIPLEAYGILTDKSIAAIPLFTIAGCLLADGTGGKRLTEFIKSAVGWIRGGAIITTVLVATLFTTFTGASGVTILALGGVLSLILTGSGSSEDNAEALITSSGSLGVLLPPSLAVILYAVTNIFSGANVIDIFKGAFLPGVLLATSTIVLGIILDKNKTKIKFSKTEFKTSFKQSFLELFLPIAIFVLYFSGIFNLLQTAAFAAIYTLITEVFVRKNFTLKEAFSSIVDNIPVVGGVLVIVGAAKGLAFFLIDADIPNILSNFVIAHVSSKYLFLFLLNIFLLLIGCIMDLYSAILVVSPLIIPIAESFGIHPVHTAVIFLANLVLGFLTPPVGMDLFIASYKFKKPVLKIVKNTLPYLAIQFVILLFITYVPWFSLVFVE
ncbi:MAG: TRAP transporter permease DctM/Q [Treponema sp.]|nr:MAG: TRAP transporter permease DctM/Q [Treponema sp.]